MAIVAHLSAPFHSQKDSTSTGQFKGLICLETIAGRVWHTESNSVDLKQLTRLPDLCPIGSSVSTLARPQKSMASAAEAIAD